MARTNIQVVITVKDGASKPLEKVQKGIRNTGKAARDSTADIWQFNKTLFSTFAFVGLFTRGFSKLKESMMIGADLDKVSTQFERQVGPKSKFIQALQGSTNVVFDEMTALESGLQLSNLGITRGLESTADTIAKFAVAGRMAGKDSTDVIRALTGAVTEGNVARLEELGIMKRSDPAFMALQAITAKAGGTMGGVIAKQQAMAIVMGAINKRVQGQMFAFMSLGEVIDYTSKAYTNLQRNIGILLGNAVRPLLEKLLPLIQNFNKIVESISKTDKHTLFLVKTVLALTAALSGLFATLGTMKLLVKLLGFTPLGFPGMTMAILAVTAAFVGLTRQAEGPLAKLKIFGAFFKGIYELVTNFDPETGMSKISAATEKLLADNGILGIVDFISAIIVTVRTTLTDITKLVTKAAKIVDTQFKKLFGIIDDKLKTNGKWTTWWTTNTLSNFDKVKRAAIVLAGIFGTLFIGKKLFGLAGGILSKIPVIGGLFGGSKGGKGPSGTSSDPIYTVPVGGGLGGAAGGFASGLLEKIIPKGLGTKIKDWIIADLSKGYLAKGWTAASSLFGKTAGKWIAGQLAGLSMMWDLVSKSMVKYATAFWQLIAPVAGPLIGAAAAAAIGYAIGTGINLILDKTTQGKNKEGFEGNVVERAFFKMFADKETKKRFSDFEDFKNKSDKDIINGVRLDQGKGPLSPDQIMNLEKGNKQTSISVPTTGSDDEATIQALGEQMKSMNTADREKMQEAVQNALKADSSGGSLISPEEFTNFQNMLTTAFDDSKNLQELVIQAKAKQAAARSGQRG